MRLAEKREIAQLQRNYPSPSEQWPLLLGSPLTLRSHRRNRIVVRDRYVSRYHAQIKLANRIWQITDLESANGTQVNREFITTPHQLHDGDRITSGETWFHFVEEPITGPPMPYHLGLLTPREFEELIAGLLEAEGFTSVKVIGRSVDGGIE
jgi:hypothetical protein